MCVLGVSERADAHSRQLLATFRGRYLELLQVSSAEVLHRAGLHEVLNFLGLVLCHHADVSVTFSFAVCTVQLVACLQDM